MGNKTQTATTNQTTTPVNTAALQQIYGQVANAAATPYTPYNGELVAPVNAQQTAGINGINAAANQAQPYYTQAGQLASGASNPLTSAQIQQYQNPYTQSVVNATQAQLSDLNGQQQNQLKGNAAAEGALGGDRQAVAQSTLAGQQALNEAPTIANLYANSYNSGLNTAENQFQQNPLAAASSIANIGAGAQNAALTGAGQQINAGTLQQQTQQALDQANYGQYQAAQGFPFQEAAYLEQYGLPAALAQGSTTSGAQTAQGPSNIAPYLGAGIAGAGLFLKDGGEVNGYAPGGGVSYISAPDYINAGQGYLSNTSPSQSTLQTPSLQFLKQNSSSSSSVPMTGSGSFGSLGSSLQNDFGSASFGGGNVLSDDAWGGDKSNPLPGLDASDYGYKVGGLVEAIHGIHKAIKRSRGGSVSSLSPFQAFDDGGDVSFSDRFQPAVDSPLGSLSPTQAEGLLTATNSDNAVINPDSPFRLDPSGPVQGDPSNMPVGIPSNAPSVVASDVGSSPMTAALPPQITNPDNVPDSPALAYDNTQSPTSSVPTIASFVSPPEDGHAGLLGTNLSDKTRSALIAAGLGIMASRSPFLGVALGEGGLQGLKNYSETTKAEQEAADKAATRAQEQQRIDLQAKQIAANIDNQRRQAAIADVVLDKNGNPVVSPAYKAKLQAQQDVKIPNGYREKDDGTYEAIPGGPADPAVLKAAAEAKRVANAVLDDDTIHDMAGQYLAGDRTVMQNLGRGQQGAENIVKLRQEIARQARDQGIDPKGIVNAFNEQAGALAGQRAVGTRAANISLAANEANNMIPIALAASDKLPRTQFMPWNQMVQAVQKGTSSPELASFVAATNSLVNAYVRAVSPSGVPTDSMRQHAYDMLNAAQGPEAYKAVVATMQKEMQAALQAPGQVKAELRKGNDPTAAAMPSGTPTAIPANKPTTVIQNGHTYTLQPDGSYK